MNNLEKEKEPVERGGLGIELSHNTLISETLE